MRRDNTKPFHSTKSYQNIKEAFAGESQAVSRYLIFSHIAREEGHLETAKLFEKMADNEREHAKVWFKYLNDGFDITEKNLISAATGENTEWKGMYPQFAAEAREEGYEDLAVMFERIASIECDHERKFLEASFAICEDCEGGDYEEDSSEEKFFCLFCGFGAGQPLDVCPVCQSKGAFAQ